MRVPTCDICGAYLPSDGKCRFPENSTHKIHALTTQLAQVTAERDEARAVSQKIIDTVDLYWDFGDDQCHRHTWHSKQDCLEKCRAMLADSPAPQLNQ